MRVMLRARLDTPTANEKVKNGTMPQFLQSITERLNAEAVYFTPNEGKRSCVIIFDMQDSSQMPATVEPFLQEFAAEIEIQPVMNVGDLQKGLQALSQR